MDHTSAQFHIASEVKMYRDEAGRVDKGPTNDCSNIIQLPNLIAHLEMPLSLTQINRTLIMINKKGTRLIHD